MKASPVFRVEIPMYEPHGKQVQKERIEFYRGEINTVSHTWLTFAIPR